MSNININPIFSGPLPSVDSASFSGDTVQRRTLDICSYIHSKNLTPKKFIQNLLDSPHQDVASLRRFWGTITGWDSTTRVLMSIKRVVLQGEDGCDRWADWILSEVSDLSYYYSSLNPSLN